MLTAILLLQAAAPDIQIDARVRARSLTIEKRGKAELVVRTDPEGSNLVAVRALEANGRKAIRNFEASVRAEARIADPQSPTVQVETSAPQ